MKTHFNTSSAGYFYKKRLLVCVEKVKTFLAAECALKHSPPSTTELIEGNGYET